MANHQNESTNEAVFVKEKQRWRTVEILVFLFLIVPSMILSFFAMIPGTLTFRTVAYSSIFRDLSLISLILYFIWRNGESVLDLGWTFQNVSRETILGIILFIPFTAATGVLDKGLQSVGLSAPTKPLPSFLAPKNLEEIVLACLLVVVVAVAEETIFRGYLLLRFRGIAFNDILAILLSAAIFSLGHGYEGSAGVVTVGVMGAVFAVVYLWRRSLVAPMVMHFLQDFVGIVVAPLLGLK